jgi:integrase
VAVNDAANLRWIDCPFSYEFTDSSDPERQKMTARATLRLVSPTKEIRTVTPRRPKNADVRPREHLTEHEVDRLLVAAKANRNGQRDATMLLVCFRHGLRASELCELQLNFRD